MTIPRAVTRGAYRCRDRRDEWIGGEEVLGLLSGATDHVECGTTHTGEQPDASGDDTSYNDRLSGILAPVLTNVVLRTLS